MRMLHWTPTTYRCPLCGELKNPDYQTMDVHEIVNRNRLTKTEIWNLPEPLHTLICRRCNGNEGLIVADSMAARLMLLRHNIEIYGREAVFEALQFCDATLKVGLKTGILLDEGDHYEMVPPEEIEILMMED
jgi:hypothetical protein